MNRTCFALLLVWLAFPTSASSQVNPMLKKYAGAYHLLPFGEMQPTASSDKIIFTADGNWTSTSFPRDANGVPAKVAVKKVGKWKASENLITVSSAGSGETAYRWEDGLWMGTNTYLVKVFVSNPAFVAKYAGSYHFLYYGESEPTDFTETITLKADGKCTASLPTTDNSGAISKTPTVSQGTWKANDGVIQITLALEASENTTEYALAQGVFTDKQGNTLRKVVPPPPPSIYLAKYAGTYHMIGEGETPTATSEKYLLKADGTGTWTFFMMQSEWICNHHS